MGKFSPLAKLCLGLIGIMALVNLIAVFAPEMGFDALWYHLTLSKLFLTQHRWFYPGGLLYYSAMPRLGDTLFIPLLQLFGTAGPKFLQYLSGLITTYFVYQIAREFYDQNRSILGALLFYTTWLVGWQSGSAYVDLIRTMFETIALYFALKDKKILTGISLGLAVGVKWHALLSVFIFGAFFSPLIIPIALLTAAPWFYLSWHFTDRLVYPLFEPFMAVTQLSQVQPHFFAIDSIIKRLISIPYSLALPFDDMLNPVISLLFIVGLFVVILQKNYRLKSVLIVASLGLIAWQLTPPPSSRYLLPFLPAIIVVALSSLNFVSINKVLIFLVITSSMGLIFLRTYANSKYLPVVTGRLTTNQFLADNSAKLPGTFIDSDNWVEQNIPNDALVLIENWHNLYYLPRNFDHVSWAASEREYDYLITSGRDVKTVHGKLLHTNSLGAQIFQL